ncbi:hypothetical protein CSUI_006052, partial [Cystoisospora suis]
CLAGPASSRYRTVSYGTGRPRATRRHRALPLWPVVSAAYHRVAVAAHRLSISRLSTAGFGGHITRDRRCVLDLVGML